MKTEHPAMEHNFEKLVLAKLELLGQNIDSLRGEMGDFRGDFGIFRDDCMKQFKLMNARVSHLEDRVDNLDQKVDGLDQKVNGLDHRLSDLEDGNESGGSADAPKQE